MAGKSERAAQAQPQAHWNRNIADTAKKQRVDQAGSGAQGSAKTCSATQCFSASRLPSNARPTLRCCEADGPGISVQEAMPTYYGGCAHTTMSCVGSRVNLVACQVLHVGR